MAFVDHTQQYRHSVLIGNWNEEEFGLERAANPAAGATGLPSQERFKSVQKASYVRPDTEALYAAADARVSAPDCRKGVGAGLITQDGVQGSQYFQSSYAKSWGQGQTGTIKPDYTLSKVTTTKLEKIDLIQLEESEQRGCYRTEASDNYNAAVLKPRNNK